MQQGVINIPGRFQQIIKGVFDKPGTLEFEGFWHPSKIIINQSKKHRMMVKKFHPMQNLNMSFGVGVSPNSIAKNHIITVNMMLLAMEASSYFLSSKGLA